MTLRHGAGARVQTPPAVAAQVVSLTPAAFGARRASGSAAMRVPPVSPAPSDAAARVGLRRDPSVMCLGPRSMVFDEGDTARSLFELVEGSVMMFNTLRDGRRQITALLGVGSIVGFTSTGSYANSVQALEPIRLLLHDPRVGGALSDFAVPPCCER